MKALLAAIVIVVAIFLYRHFYGPITYSTGVLIDSAPSQVAIGEKEPVIEFGEFHLKPLARFSIDARILHRKVYGYDRSSKLVPVDLAVGWGPMSDQAVLDQMKITQSMRFYWYEYRTPPIPKDQIISNSTNLHVIPASPAIAKFCKSLRQGELVHLDGELVEATGPGIGTWRSSLTRTDSGNGACELLFVETCSKLNPSSNSATTLVQR